MSVTVRHLNADSTFLLIFSPQSKPSQADLQSANGAFSVLIDPWLVGSSIVNASWFAVTHRVIPSAIKHLSEIEEPDVVLVTQNKPDHCHKQTLLQLRPEGKTLIAAEAGAAKAIKSWNYFDPYRVHALSKYDVNKRFGNVLRLRIPPLGVDGLPGELSIAFIPAKNYVTGLHNGFGITYQPPSHTKALAPVTTIDLPRRKFSMAFSPASLPPLSPLIMFSPDLNRPHTTHVKQSNFDSPALPIDDANGMSEQNRDRPHTSKASNHRSLEFSPTKNCSKILSPASQNQGKLASPDAYWNDTSLPVSTSTLNMNHYPNTADFMNPSSSSPPSDSPTATSATVSPRTSNASEMSDTDAEESISLTQPTVYSLPFSPSLHDIQSRYSRPPAVHPPRPKAISVLYSPHGLPLQDLQPYIQNHLVTLPGALPLTCLIHSFSYATNPWWFGGNIMMGARGGTEIAKALMARTWISAHDEEKDDRGIAVKMLKCEKTSAEMIQRKIEEEVDTWSCNVRSLDVGEEICLNSSDDQTTKRQQSKEEHSTHGLGFDMAAFKLQDAGG